MFSMITRVIIYFSLVLSFLFVSCSPKHSEIVLAELGDSNVKMREFEDAYIKNAGGLEQAKTDSLNKLKNFLDLYANFKMKLRDASVRGFEQDSELMNELNDYKKKVGVTFILEKNIVDPDSTGEEAARLKAVTILDSIKKGSNFEELAKRNSQDYFSAPLGGDIFYVTAGLLPVEFEDACYKTAAGKIYSDVVKTKYGYHVIKVTEKRERIPKIKASHILVDFNNSSGVMDTIATKATIDSVKMMLNAGADFAELASKYSEDPGSKDKGGDLGFFERRMMVKEFDEAAFNLKVGEVSDVVKSNFGYHIIKLTEKAPMPSLDEERENIKKIYKQTRYQDQYDKLVDSLRNKYSYKVNALSYSLFVEKSDSVKVGDESPKLEEINDTPDRKSTRLNS